MHQAILEFAQAVPFEGSVLDVGALDVNGALSSVIPVTLRVDMRLGPGVDEAVSAEGLIERFGRESWDNVASADMLEHAKDWRACMENMWGVLKPGGILLLTMASIQKGRHAYPDDYWRFTLQQFLSLFGDNEVLSVLHHRISIGAIVRKSAPLTLKAEPMAVPP